MRDAIHHNGLVGAVQPRVPGDWPGKPRLAIAQVEGIAIVQNDVLCGSDGRFEELGDIEDHRVGTFRTP